MKVMIFYLIHDKSPIIYSLVPNICVKFMCDKGQGICTPCIHWVTLLVDAQPYGCFIFLNCTTAVKSPPTINCVHFHCSFYEGCIQILNGSVTQITFSFMWTDFPNYALLYTQLIDNQIWILDYFLIVGSLQLILSLDMYLFHVFLFTCLFSFMWIDFWSDFHTYVWHQIILYRCMYE